MEKLISFHSFLKLILEFILIGQTRKNYFQKIKLVYNESEISKKKRW
jgi:hypothetical protein